MTRNPMDDGAYMTAYPEYENISAGAQIAAAHRQRDDLKALVEKLRALFEERRVLQDRAKRAEPADALVRKLRAALERAYQRLKLA